MRTSYLFILTLILFVSTSFHQKPEASADQPLSKEERLYLTCKIWGFIKYYHPLVGKGSYNWDDRLQKLLDNTDHLNTHEAFSDYIARWIYLMGPRNECKSCNQRNGKDAFLENFDLSWTQSNRFSDELKSALKDIERNRFQGNHHYIEVGKSQNFEPKNEEIHHDLNWKLENERLLPLFRYWNYIEYFFPYKYQTDQSWDEVLKELIPVFINAETELDFHLAMLEMVTKIDDTHASFMTSVIEQNMPYYNYLPVKIDLIENQAVVTEIVDAEKARLNDLKVGDVIMTVNGKPVSALHHSNKKYIPGSNDAAKDRTISYTLFMGMRESPTATIKRGESTRNVTLELYQYPELNITKKSPQDKWREISDSIGYVNLGELFIADVDQVMNSMMDKTVIIFDVRNNPKGTYKAIAKYLNPSETTFAKFTKPDLSYPGKFIWQGEGTCGEENADYYKGKVILLVNEQTQSHAEYTCMCLQTAPNVVTVGSQTAGADGSVTKFAVVQRYYTSMTGMGVFYPDGTKAQRIGIVPDVFVTPTITGVKAGTDEILERAIALAQDEVARVMAEEMARQQAILDSIRTDSLRRVDSLRMMMPPMDSLSADSLDSVDDY